VGGSILSKGICGEDDFKFRREEEPEPQWRTAGMRQAKKEDIIQIGRIFKNLISV
jgi:hypothetical protein